MEKYKQPFSYNLLFTFRFCTSFLILNIWDVWRHESLHTKLPIHNKASTYAQKCRSESCYTFNMAKASECRFEEAIKQVYAWSVLNTNRYDRCRKGLLWLW